MMDVPSKLSVIRKTVALARIFPTLDLIIEENLMSHGGSGRVHDMFSQAELLKLQFVVVYYKSKTRVKESI